MRILAQYMSREFLKLFGILVMGFVAIYTIFDFIEKADNFAHAGVPTSAMLSFFLLQVPEITSLMVPVAVLMSTVITLGLMGKRNELVAVKSSGVSLFRFSLPILLTALAMTMAVALLNETILPRTKAKTNYIWDVLVEKRPDKIFLKEKFWYKGQNSIYRVGFYDPETQSLADVVYYRFDKDFNLAMRVDARRVRYLGGRWVFFSGLMQQRLAGGGYSGQAFEEQVVDLPEKPHDFTKLSKPSEEMSFGELVRFVKKIEDEGYDSRRYRVDLQSKLSFPFVCLIMALVGVPLALFKERGQYLAAGVVLGLGVALLYWISFSYMRSIFGYTGVLPPFLAAWLPNGIFSLLGLWLFSTIRQ
ncbi:MAG: LPS export ABC transporter permease LptG [Desulfarculus sp.]|nr:LPS export ABC transporter permease LptG [Desulfarculus sp.]